MKEFHRGQSGWGLLRVPWVGDRGFTSAEIGKLLQAVGDHVLFVVKDNAKALARPGRFWTAAGNNTEKEA